MNRPTILQVGGVLYWVLQTRNPDTMVLKDADSDPTVAVRKNGASVADSVTVTKRTATTGIYDCSYNPASEAEGDSFTLEETAVVTGTTTASATYKASFVARVVAVERGTDGANTTAPLTTLGANAPANWFNAASLSADAGAEIAALVETYIVNEGDATAVMQAIANLIAADWVAGDASPLAIAAAVRTNLSTELGRLDVAVGTRLAPTVASRTLNVSVAGAGDAVLDSAGQQMVAAFNAMRSGNVFTAPALANAPSGGGGGGTGDASQTTLLEVQATAEAIASGISGRPIDWAGNVGPGGVLELTLGDDHETVNANSLPIRVNDVGGTLYDLLTDAGVTLQWSAGQNLTGGLITGTVASVTHAADVTTVTVEVPNCAATGNVLAPYVWQLQRTVGGRRARELQGTLRLRADMF